ncbi:MAG: MFS transporter [Alphaproteobacteria bacterium]|nr:MFS transporter [Alphaproteobacteria bacterium]
MSANGKMNKKVIISGMLGNGLEWYDYALYGHMAIIITKLFFPSVDPVVGLLATYGTFAAGFLARPLGAILFGYVGDTFGRKTALAIAILMMAIPTGLIGLLPTYADWGWIAPACLIMIRILQGLSMGGEFSGAITYMVEHSPQNKRAVAGSAAIISLVLGFLLGSIVSTSFASALSPEDFESWGWRVPFLLGIVVGVVGFYIRSHCDESPAYEEAKAEGTLSKTPVRDAFKKHPKSMIQAFCIYLFVTMPFYMISIYFIAYTTKQLEQPYDEALLINSFAMLAMLVTVPISAHISDRVGRKKVLMTAILLMFVVIYPAFQLMHAHSDFYSILAGQVLLGLALGVYLAPVPAVLVELFPTSIRFTGMSLSYNFCAILGGLTPMLSTWLIAETGNNDSIMYIIIGAGLASFLTLLTYHDRWREPIRSLK